MSLQRLPSKLEQEIQELQRKFRVLENDKRAYSEDAQGVIRKQRATIEKLTRENRKMKQDLNDARAVPSNRSEQKLNADKLSRTTEQKDVLERRLAEETERSGKLDEQQDLLVTRLQQIRTELAKRGGKNVSKEIENSIHKNILISENRLNTALQKFNETLTGNKELRVHIDGLRRERQVFDGIYKKLESELGGKKREMANIIEQANAAYEARDQAQAQMAALKQQADKEHVEFEKEWRELGRLIENDKKMKEFMRQKERRRLEDSLRDANAKQEEEKRKAQKQALQQAQLKEDANRANQEKLRIYEEAFSKIQAATGITHIDELVDSFIEAEDKNFSLFNYANTLTADLEKLEVEAASLKGETAQLKGLNLSSKDSAKQKALMLLEEQWTRTEKKAENYEQLHQQSQKTLTAVRAAIQSIFNRIGCNSADTLERLGTPNISESSMLKFLAVIEERTMDIASFYQFSSGQLDDAALAGPLAASPAAGKSGKGGKVGPGGTGAAGATAGVGGVFKLPSTVEDLSDEDEEEEEDDQRPFNRDELKQRIVRVIQKRQDKLKKPPTSNIGVVPVTKLK